MDLTFQLTTTRAAELFPTLKRRTNCFSAGTVTPQLSLVTVGRIDMAMKKCETQFIHKGTIYN